MKGEQTPMWDGFTVVCMASGPSLTEMDAETVRQWRGEAENRRVIVTNTTYKMAPWADVLFAMDAAWWRHYGDWALKEFPGERLSVATVEPRHATKIEVPLSGNSGAGAMSLARVRGASNIILLGYDCQYTGGKKHWHGDHPIGLGNCLSLPKFPRHFDQLRAHMEASRVINASRYTSLRQWPRMPLIDALREVA